jgi:hypothetical protein
MFSLAFIAKRAFSTTGRLAKRMLFLVSQGDFLRDSFASGRIEIATNYGMERMLYSYFYIFSVKIT